MPTPDAPIPPRYGFSRYHDRVLDYCVAEHGGCPFNCAKNGAANCFFHVARRECEPAQQVQP